MPVTATYDTQQGATVALSVDSLALRVVSIEPVKVRLPILDSTNLANTTKRTKAPGELKDYQGVRVRYQNSPALANPAMGTLQTILITGPVPTGGTTGEIETGTGFVYEEDESPGYDANQEALQMKEFTFVYDGLTGPTHSVAA